MKLRSLLLVILGFITMNTQLQAATIINEINNKGVNQVHWQKYQVIDAQKLADKAIPKNNSNLFFLRLASNDGLQTSINLAINDRFQVSLQPNHYSQVYACSGIAQISGEITGHKNNDLLKNAIPVMLEPNTTYYFLVQVGDNGNTNIRPMTSDTAKTALKNMTYQTHQISRIMPNCPSTTKPALISQD